MKQRWPEAFRDVCLYSEVCQLLGSYTYGLSARHFIQEMFSDVPFKEVFDEAEVLLKRLPSATTMTPSSPHRATEAFSRFVHLKTYKKILNTEVRQQTATDGIENVRESDDTVEGEQVTAPFLSFKVKKSTEGDDRRLDEPLFIEENKLDLLADFDNYCGITDDKSEDGEKEVATEGQRDSQTDKQKRNNGPVGFRRRPSDELTSNIKNRRSVEQFKTLTSSIVPGAAEVTISVLSEDNAPVEATPKSLAVTENQPSNLTRDISAVDAGDDRKPEDPHTTESKDHPIADGGIVLLSPTSNNCRTRGNQTLSDYEGLSTDDEDDVDSS